MYPVVSVHTKGGKVARARIPTDRTFTSEEAAWKEVTDNYTASNNYIMRGAKKAGKKVHVGVERVGRKDLWIIVIYVG
jgi:hypothetical protein